MYILFLSLSTLIITVENEACHIQIAITYQV